MRDLSRLSSEQLSLQTEHEVPVAKNGLGAFKSLNEVLDDRRTVVLLDEVSTCFLA